MNLKYHLFSLLLFYAACSDENDSKKQVDANGLLSYQLMHDEISRSFSLYVPKNSAQKNQRPYYLIFMEEGVMVLGIFMYQTCVQLLIRQTLYWYIQMDITVYGTVRFPQIQLLKHN